VISPINVPAKAHQKSETAADDLEIRVPGLAPKKAAISCCRRKEYEGFTMARTLSKDIKADAISNAMARL